MREWILVMIMGQWFQHFLMGQSHQQEIFGMVTESRSSSIMRHWIATPDMRIYQIQQLHQETEFSPEVL